MEGSVHQTCEVKEKILFTHFIVFEIKEMAYLLFLLLATILYFQYYEYWFVQAFLAQQGFEYVQSSSYHIFLGDLLEICWEQTCSW